MSIYRWLPSIGTSGLAIANGAAFPKWKGDLIAGGLSGANVDRIRVKNDQVVETETLLLNKGRVRDIQMGPDGFIYVALNQPDKIVRLVPAK
jgi:glucose/arabinose dehydrogenase